MLDLSLALRCVEVLHLPPSPLLLLQATIMLALMLFIGREKESLVSH